MSTWLGTPWPPDFSRKPPRMSAEDYEIWKRWYPNLNPWPECIYFDVGIGPGEELALGYTSDTPLNRMWTRNTQRRIDAVLVYKAAVWIVELRYQASPSAVGRMLAYRMLWQEDPPIKMPAFYYLITNYPLPDVAQLAKEQGITYLTV